MNRRFDNMDAAESVFAVRALEAVKAKAYDIKYPQFLARSLIPTASDVDPAAKVVTYRQYDQFGLAKIISGYSDDLPRADVSGKEYTSPVRPIATSYGYNIYEIRHARKEGIDLEQKKANAARRAFEERIESIAFTGDSTYGLLGLSNQTNATIFTVPNNEADDSSNWADKSADEILADLFGIGDYVISQTRGAEKPDTMLLPQAQYSLAARTLLTSTGTDTVLDFFIRTNKNIKTVEVWDLLKGAGSASTDRMLVYPRNTDALELIIPQDFEQLDGQPRNLEVVVPCHGTCGGVLVYYPLAVAYGDGI